MAAVSLRDVDLEFEVRPCDQRSLKQYVLNLGFADFRRPTRLIRALQGVSLDFSEGERVGVMGSNGAGKTTLLRTIAGVYAPTRGRCQVSGRISSLFELQMGFEIEASGWQNIYCRGLLMGASPAAIKARTPEIAEFAELGKFLDIPVKYYSAGMQMRLAFAIATAFEPEILLVDEFLSVGDQDFQRKAYRRMRELVAQAKLMVMVSHEPKALRDHCTRVIRLEQGRVVADGTPSEVVAGFSANSSRASSRRDEQSKPGLESFSVF